MRFQLFCDQFELFFWVQTLRENHICSSVYVSLWSFDTLLKSIYAFGVSPGAYDELAFRNFDTRFSRNFNFINHLRGRNKLFSVQMPTSLRKNLILNVHSTGSTVKKVANSPCAHLSLPESCIGICNDWKIGESWDVFDDFGELI